MVYLRCYSGLVTRWLFGPIGHRFCEQWSAHYHFSVAIFWAVSVVPVIFRVSLLLPISQRHSEHGALHTNKHKRDPFKCDMCLFFKHSRIPYTNEAYNHPHTCIKPDTASNPRFFWWLNGPRHPICRKESHKQRLSLEITPYTIRIFSLGRVESI